MTEKMPRTPLSTSLSGSARETELRLRNIFSGPKKRPPLPMLALMGALCLLCGNLVSCRMTEPEAGSSPQPSPQPSPVEAGEARLSLQRAAEEKLNGYRYPRESIQQDILGEKMEFVLHHGNGWTMYVPAAWEMNNVGTGWIAPSQKARFTVYKYFHGDNPQQYRAKHGARRYETSYDPPFDCYYDEDHDNDYNYLGDEDDDDPPPAGSVDCIYFFAPNGLEGYEFTLMTVVGETTEAEKRIQEAMLLSFRLDDTSHVLNCGDYTPGQTQWEAAMAGLMSPTERMQWIDESILINGNGKETPDYLSYALELGEFRPEEFTQYFNLGPLEIEFYRKGIAICLPDRGIWLNFYPDTPWVCVSLAGENYWAEFHDPNNPNRMIFDTARTWLEAYKGYTAEQYSGSTSS